MFKKILCLILGHENKKFLIDGDSVHLSNCCFIRILICQRCEK